MSWDQIYRLVKNEFGITRTPPKWATYILPSGEFLDLEKWWIDYDGVEDDDDYEYERENLYKNIEYRDIDWNKINPGRFPMHSLVQYLIDTVLYKRESVAQTTKRLEHWEDTMIEYGCIKVNSGETLYDKLYIALPETRPTDAALKALDDYIFHQFYKRGKKDVRVYVEGKHWAEAKYKREDYPNTKDIIKKISKYFASGRLDDEEKIRMKDYYTYLFPRLSEGDIEKLAEYDLKVEKRFSREVLVSGTKEDLMKYAVEYLNYSPSEEYFKLIKKNHTKQGRWSPARRAWLMNTVISGMNNERAYHLSGWLYEWPDGTTREACEELFETEEDIENLYATYLTIFEDYYKDGFYKINMYETGVEEFIKETLRVLNIEGRLIKTGKDFWEVK